jgi:Tfp pilus assembly protein PilN
MKITTNFVRPAQHAVKPVAAGLWLSALALAAGSAWLVNDGASLRKELPDLQQRLARIEKSGHGAPVQAVRLPPAQELAETRERVARINAAAQTKGISTQALLAELEVQLPPQAWLVSFHHRAAEGEAVLVAAAASDEPLSGFLLKLEHDPLFEEAMLVRELQPSGAGKTGVQFEIRLKVRS